MSCRIRNIPEHVHVVLLETSCEFIKEIKMKNCVLLSSNLPSVIDRSHFDAMEV